MNNARSMVKVSFSLSQRYFSSGMAVSSTKVPRFLKCFFSPFVANSNFFSRVSWPWCSKCLCSFTMYSSIFGDPLEVLSNSSFSPTLGALWANLTASCSARNQIAGSTASEEANGPKARVAGVPFQISDMTL